MAANRTAFESLIPTAAGIAVAFAQPQLSQCRENDAASSAKISYELTEFARNQQSNSITGNPSWEIFQSLQSRYEVTSPRSVLSFLNGPITSLLLLAEPIIREYFDVSKIVLDVKIDPEDQSSVMLVTIHTSTDWEIAEENLERFDREWWLSQSWYPSRKRICIDVYPA